MSSARLFLLASCVGTLAAGCVVGDQAPEAGGTLDSPPALPTDFPGTGAEALTTSAPRANFSFTRSGNTVTFRNTSTGQYDSMQWWVGRECLLYDLDYVDWVVHSTSRTEFSAYLPKTAQVPEPNWNQMCAVTYYWVSAYLVSKGAPIPGSGIWRQIQVQ